MTTQPEDTMADPYVEGLAQLFEAQRNRAAAFTLRSVGPVGTVHQAMLAKLRELFVPVDQKAEMAAALERIRRGKRVNWDGANFSYEALDGDAAREIARAAIAKLGDKS